MPEPEPTSAPSSLGEAELRRIMELLFFAYRDFTAEPDAVLATYGFGRAHHRVIYFVGRHPGITVNGLLAILAITKQSLNRVLGQLLAEGFVERRADADDRRRRRLHLTPKGDDLDRLLRERQSVCLQRAFREASPAARKGFEAMLLGIINEADRGRFEELTPDPS